MTKSIKELEAEVARANNIRVALAYIAWLVVSVVVILYWRPR